ncbi:MAG: DUF4435 domain-containing protein [Oscillatoriales cyanobacterium RU_3_3]|nr:DUF4435 domain-containing protein [Oscillatoriales cyanobacterium RU_3_3]
MEDEKRRKLKELIARYELEPSLCDIYVEGLTDKFLIQWFLDKLGIDNYAIYEIDTVEIPANELFELGLNDSNRGRVIALALKLGDYFRGNLPSVICIADRDFDYLLGSSEFDSNLLLLTDCTSIEMYLFNSSVLEKFVKLALRTDNLTSTKIIKNLAPILEEMFLLRAANHELKYGMEWLVGSSLKRCLKRKGDRAEFNSNDFIEKYLNKNSRISDKSNFLCKVQELRQKNIEDVKNKIRGHDFIDLLCWYIEPYLASSRKGFIESDVAFGALLCCLDIDRLMEERLFQELAKRYRRSNSLG